MPRVKATAGQGKHHHRHASSDAPERSLSKNLTRPIFVHSRLLKVMCDLFVVYVGLNFSRSVGVDAFVLKVGAEQSAWTHH